MDKHITQADNHLAGSIAYLKVLQVDVKEAKQRILEVESEIAVTIEGLKMAQEEIQKSYDILHPKPDVNN